MIRQSQKLPGAIIFIAIVGWPVVVVCGFLLPKFSWKMRCPSNAFDMIPPYPRSTSSLQVIPVEIDRDLLLIDWDGGCLVDTVHYRINVAYQAAALVWPELKAKIEASSTAVATATSERQTSWLTNKLEAVAPVLHEDTRYLSATAQYVLAVRLLLEEQELDQGQSPGTGKYGSIYHPQREQKDSESSAFFSTSSGSRPLTVSEVSTNWCELLLDTLPIKYRVRPNQLEEAVLQCMDEIYHREDDYFPAINTGVASMLVTIANGQAGLRDDNYVRAPLPVVTIRHGNDMPLAEKWITKHFQDSKVQVKVMEGISQLWSPIEEHHPTIYLLHKRRDTVTNLLECTGSAVDCDGTAYKASQFQTVHVVESSWEALQWDTSHTDHPVVADRGMDLKLIAWCPTPEMERRAIMCPWSSACTSALELEECLGIQRIAFQ